MRKNKTATLQALALLAIYTAFTLQIIVWIAYIIYPFFR